MNTNFAAALALVLNDEGGYSNNTSDPGGPTNKGITLANYREFIKPHGTVADLKKITLQQVATVYRRQYWNAVQGDRLPAGVDYATFDFAVNSGPGRAADFLQDVVGVPVDGQIGPVTLSAINGRPPAATITSLCDRRLEFLKGLPTWQVFGRGWAARLERVQVAALRMVSQPSP